MSAPTGTYIRVGTCIHRVPYDECNNCVSDVYTSILQTYSCKSHIQAFSTLYQHYYYYTLPIAIQLKAFSYPRSQAFWGRGEESLGWFLLACAEMTDPIACGQCYGSIRGGVYGLFVHAVAIFRLKEQWTMRISDLLCAGVSISDAAPKYLCSKCRRRLVVLQNTAVDLVDFRDEERQSYGSITSSIKRPSDPNGSVTVSPDTAGLRPPSKRALQIQER